MWSDSSFFLSLDKDEKTSYIKKLTLANDEVLPDPYTLKKDWQNDPKDLPDITFGDIHMYLVKSPSSGITHESMKALKSLDSYNFFYVVMYKTSIFITLMQKANFVTLKQRFVCLCYIVSFLFFMTAPLKMLYFYFKGFTKSKTRPKTKTI